MPHAGVPSHVTADVRQAVNSATLSDEEIRERMSGNLCRCAAYAAHFVEVHVDPAPGTIRVARVLSTIDGGRILNPKTARSQIVGGIAMGIGMALLEETVSDRPGRLVTTSLAE